MLILDWLLQKLVLQLWLPPTPPVAGRCPFFSEMGTFHPKHNPTAYLPCQDWFIFTSSSVCLSLQSNSISSAGLTALTAALCSNKGLINLNLRENSISKEGGPAIARALQANSTLRKLE